MAKSKKLKFLMVLGFLFLVLGGATYTILNWGYSIGSRSGKLVKLSHRGVLFKEWEGILDLGSGDKLTWEFSVRDDHIGKELAKQVGEMITVDYKEHVLSWPYITKYDVTNWRINDVQKAKICPFLYILQDDQPLQKKVAEMMIKKRADLLPEIKECLERLDRGR